MRVVPNEATYSLLWWLPMAIATGNQCKVRLVVTIAFNWCDKFEFTSKRKQTSFVLERCIVEFASVVSDISHPQICAPAYLTMHKNQREMEGISIVQPEVWKLDPVPSIMKWNQNKTRLHSSRMHTARLLTVSPSMHCTGGCLLLGVSASVGCLLLWEGVWFGGCLVLGVSASGGVSAFRGWYPSMH